MARSSQRASRKGAVVPGRRARLAPCMFFTSAVVLVGLLAGVSEAPAFFFTKTDDATVAAAKEAVRNADAIFFDVDSTVVVTEGINLLGKCFGVMDEIAAMTRDAMNGSVKFQDAMAQRLELMASRGMKKDSLKECVKTEGRPRWSPGVKEVVKRFHAKGVHVYLVSGGFVNMIKPIAKGLHIPKERVYANTILFDEAGEYAGFDKTALTCRSGGKPAVLKKVQKEMNYTTMVMFGDGATDMDARINGPAAAFVGYGGVEVRSKVKKGADWFIYNFREVLDILPKK